MTEIIKMLAAETDANYLNLVTAIKTYDRSADVCGTPAWRYVYHTVYSADRWFIDPADFTAPDLGKTVPADPDAPCDTEMSDEELLDYLQQVRKKTSDYISTLSPESLWDKMSCGMTRLELILRQFRHISFHTGLLNGQTIERTGRFPQFVGASSVDRLKKGSYDE